VSLSAHPALAGRLGVAARRFQWVKEPGIALLFLTQPVPCQLRLPSQSLELLHGPSDQMLVDAPCDEIQLGAIEGSVIVDPASDLGIDAPGEVGQVRTAATVEVPVPDLLALRLLRLGTDGR
jgi:hypothetical protein